MPICLSYVVVKSNQTRCVSLKIKMCDVCPFKKKFSGFYHRSVRLSLDLN